MKICKISSSTSDSDVVNNFKMSDNKIFFNAFSLSFKIILTENAFSKTNETIFLNRDFSEFMISSIVRSAATVILNLLKLKNKKFVKVKEIVIEAVLDRKN